MAINHPILILAKQGLKVIFACKIRYIERQIDGKYVTFDRRRGSRKQSYAEGLTGKSICGGKNPTVEENQTNILSTFNDGNSSDDKVAITPEKVKEISLKWITNEGSRRKCK